MTDLFTSVMAGPERDGRDRPMLVPAGMPKGATAPYSRASSCADRVKDKRHIHIWEQRYLARSMSQPGQQDLRDLAAGEVYTSSKLAEDVGKNRQSGKNLDSIIKRALDRVGIHFLADRGTAIHSFCEDRDRLYEVPDHLKPYVQGYWSALDRHGIKLRGVEIFIANDHVMAAGTFDSIVWHPVYGWCIADIKTGDIDPGYAVQTAIYANGELYDTDTDERHPLEMLTDGEEINRKVGLIFDVKPEGTKVLTIDLVKGWELTLAIKTVSDDLNMGLFGEVKPSDLFGQIAKAPTRQHLEDLFRASGGDWVDAHNAAAKARVAELEAS